MSDNTMDTLDKDMCDEATPLSGGSQDLSVYDTTDALTAADQEQRESHCLLQFLCRSVSMLCILPQHIFALHWALDEFNDELLIWALFGFALIWSAMACDCLHRHFDSFQHLLPSIKIALYVGDSMTLMLMCGWSTLSVIVFCAFMSTQIVSELIQLHFASRASESTSLSSLNSDGSYDLLTSPYKCDQFTDREQEKENFLYALGMELTDKFTRALTYYNVLATALSTLPFLYFHADSPFHSYAFRVYVVFSYWMLSIMGEIKNYKARMSNEDSNIIVAAFVASLIAMFNFLISLCFTAYYVRVAENGFELGVCVTAFVCYAVCVCCIAALLVGGWRNMQERAQHIDSWRARTSFNKMMKPLARKYRTLTRHQI